MLKSAIVRCRVCGAETLIHVDTVIKASEIAAFARAHSGHDRYDIHLRLGPAADRKPLANVYRLHARPRTHGLPLQRR
jgi:hypothetical protein